MPRPKTKSELLVTSEDSYRRLLTFLDSLTPAQRDATFPFVHRDRNIRDVLAHLHEWQSMMLGWYESGMAGLKPQMPAKGYTWKQTPELNAVIWRKWQDTSREQLNEALAITHNALCQIIAAHTNEQLFTKRHYSWTGTTSLGSYLTSATCSHYDWALKLLRRFVRSLRREN